MKKFILCFFLFSSILLNKLQVFGQAPWILPGNAGTTILTSFVGTRDQNSLGFRTNDQPRMQIFEPNPADFRTGFVGVGDYFAFNPEANVHAHNSTNDDFVSFKVSNTNTGSTRNDGFSFGIDGGASNIARIIQHEDWPIYVNTNDIRTRINIDFESSTPVGPSLIPLTRIGIPADGAPFHPLSILHLGLSPTWSGASTLEGYRTWMDIGTLSGGASDQMYVGLIEADTANNTEIWNDYMDAVINWGDNVDPRDGANNLRFIFTSENGAFGTASQYWGLEVGRFTPTGRMGIGNFATVMEGNGSGIQPYRKLEIYDEGMDALLHTSAPQLRLTYAPGHTANSGIWTDFQTTSSGNLFINPSTSLSGTQVPGFVGINTTAPGNTLEINSNSTYSAGTIGNSGLVFTDLRSGNSTSSGNGKVLTVNSSGEVILVPDNDGGTVTSSCGTANYIPKMNTTTNVICSQIYDNASSSTVGIGMGTSVNTSFRLHVNGDVLIQPSSGNTGDLYMQDNSAAKRVLAINGQGGNSTISVGVGAGNTSTSAVENVYIGLNAGRLTGSETRNTFVGARSGEDYTATSSDGYNTFLGTLSGGDFVTGKQNTAIGETSGRYFTSGSKNTFVGQFAGSSGATSGSNNIFIGVGSYISSSTSDSNIFIGNNAGGLTTITNATTFGHNSRVDCSNCVTIAAQTTATPHMGIGIFNPTGTVPAMGTGAGGLAKLYVSGWNNGGGNIISTYFQGDIYSTASFVPSDAALKDNIQPFTDASAIINQLEAKSYNFKSNDYPSMNLPGGNQIGFLADDIAAVAPQLVHGFTNPAVFDDSGNIQTPQVDFVGVNYAGLVPILFTAIKQQKAMLDSLVIVVSNCCNNPQPLIHNNENTDVVRSTIALSNNETIILNQNAPNPFRDQTEISYTIPEFVKDAVIMFYDNSGKVWHKFEISHRGAGSLTVFGEDLRSGIYSYTLLIDGENHQTKRMMRQ